MISVICPIYNEQVYIHSCIESILSQDYPLNDVEVLFVDGMSTDKTRVILSEYVSKYPFIRVLDNPCRIVPIAMNLGIKNAVGDVILRLDAHAHYPSNYFSILVNNLFILNADNVGAACRTDVLNKNPKTLAIKEVLSHRLGVGNSVFRLGVNRVLEVDTVPFGCWRRDVFDKYGYYDVRLIRNQDIELNKRIIRGGGRICIVPDTFCTYLARETYKGIARNNYSNGKWNILTVYYTKQFNSLSIRHFIPLIFCLSLILPVIFSVLYFPLIYVSLFSFLIYVITLGWICLSLRIKKQNSFIYLMKAFFILHFSYGWGSLVGLLKLPFLRKK